MLSGFVQMENLSLLISLLQPRYLQIFKTINGPFKNDSVIVSVFAVPLVNKPAPFKLTFCSSNLFRSVEIFLHVQPPSAVQFVGCERAFSVVFVTENSLCLVTSLWLHPAYFPSSSEVPPVQPGFWPVTYAICSFVCSWSLSFNSDDCSS